MSWVEIVRRSNRYRVRPVGFRLGLALVQESNAYPEVGTWALSVGGSALILASELRVLA